MNPTILGLLVISLTLTSVKCQNFAGLMTFFDGISSGNSGSCPYKPHRTKTKFIQNSNFQNLVRDCAPGTEYDHSKCSCVIARTPQRGSNPRLNNVNPAMTALAPPAGIQDIMSELFRRFQNQPGGGVNDSPSPIVSRPNPPSQGALPSLIKPQSRSPTNQMEQVRRIIRTRPTDSKTLPDSKTTTKAPPPAIKVPKTQLVRKNIVDKNENIGSMSNKIDTTSKQRTPTARLVIDSNKVQPGPPYNPTPKKKLDTKKDAAPNTFIEFVKTQIKPNTDSKSSILNPSQTKPIKPIAGVPNVLDNLLTQGPPPELSNLQQKGPSQDATNLLQQGPPPELAKLLQQGAPPELAKLLQQGPPPDFARLLQQGPPPDFAQLLQQGPPPDFSKLLQQGPPPELAKLLQQGPPPELAKLLQQGSQPDVTKMLTQSQVPDSRLLKQGRAAETVNSLKQNPPPVIPKNTQKIPQSSSLPKVSNKGLPVNINTAMQQAPPAKKNTAQDQASALKILLQQASSQGNNMGNIGAPTMAQNTDPLSALLAMMSSMNQPDPNAQLSLPSSGTFPLANNNNNNNMVEQLPANLDQGGSSIFANLRRSNPGRAMGRSSGGSGMGGMNPLFGGSGRGSSGPFGDMGSNFGASGLGALGGGGAGADISALLAGMGGGSSGSSGLGGLGGLNLASLGGLGGATGALAAGSRSASPPDLTNVFNMQGRMTPLNMAELANVNHVLLNQMDRQGLVDVSDLTPAGLIAASKHFSRTGGAAASLLG